MNRRRAAAGAKILRRFYIPPWQVERLDKHRRGAEIKLTRSAFLSCLIAAYAKMLRERKADLIRLVSMSTRGGPTPQVAVNLPKEQVRWLEERSRRGLSQSEIVREIIYLWIAGYLDRYLPPELRVGR